MTPEKDDRVMTLFELAMDLAPEDRTAYLTRACQGDTPLFEELTERVKWEEKMSGFLLEPLIPRFELERTFDAGTVLNGQYEIVRLVGEGGMALVYEGIDHKIEERIAIKCSKPFFRRRLTPEAKNALQISHHNICRVHGIHTAQAEWGEFDFLTMEFLDGETLFDRLRRDHRLSQFDALEIAVQIGSGLDAAHRLNIVHGDLKSNNIILTRDSKGNIRAVITDFGLARQLSKATEPAARSRGSQLHGTPDFIAPELWKGARVSAASDIYALGVILYEAVTGTRPFAGKGPAACLTETPKAPSELVPQIPPRWDSVILQCLAVDPASRPQHAADILTQLGDDRPPLYVRVLSLLFLLLIGLLLAQFLPSSKAAASPLRLALLPFEADVDSNAVASGIAHDLSNRLSHLQQATQTVIAIPVTEALKYGVSTPESACATLGATHVLRVRIATIVGRLQTTAVVTDCKTRQVIQSHNGSYSAGEEAAIPKALLGTVSGAFRLTGSETRDAVNFSAYPDYAKGLYHLQHDSVNSDEAVSLLQMATKKDPQSALPYAALAEVWMQRFNATHMERWRQLAEEAAAKAEALNPDAVEVRLIAGLVAQSSGRYEEAQEHFQRALQLDPTDAYVFRRLGGLYARMKLPIKATKAYQRAIALQPDYYQPHIELGVFHYYRGQYDLASADFLEVTKLAPGLAQGHFNLGAAYSDLGLYAQGEAELREALKLEENRDTLVGLGSLLAYQKRHVEATEFYERALTKGAPSYLLLSNLADSYRRTARDAEAASTYTKALDVADEFLIQEPGDAYTRAFVGYIATRCGDQARGTREIRQALRAAPEDTKVRRLAVLVYEAMQKRDETLGLLASVPATLLGELSRQPDLADLQQDSRFINLKAQIP